MVHRKLLDDGTVVGIILAGGNGTRFGSRSPKQLAEVAGVPILGHTLHRLDSQGLAELVLASNEEYRWEIEEIARTHLVRTPHRIVSGGATRNESVANCVEEIDRENIKVILHDGVRPLVTSEVLQRVVRGLDKHRSVLPVVPSADPLVEVRQGIVEAFASRAVVMRGQSPQGFWLKDLVDALPRLREPSGFTTVYEVLCSIIDGFDVGVVDGDPENVKVTLPIDRVIVGQLLLDWDRR